ncbi:MAG: patatin-like phospholipase RssA [Gammaproteobacteria bacterium]|nr:patatin-like phospholipase RssA [Gammaproteobacteria bacterium]MCW8839591.1 patatin-like phospholipase RssA [Gammaproteobacteria bacterium]MCW8959035.1 patatin-like phospholipase RssA [Gammaproteobacteria bacterium]MCW8973203.1 patatin-like phospholipase RssA [Gammaproteobacteria bacterium]MCW8993948.1 patatin-like phospholipase RssA [Gammaproteobacteria bacterium]
MADIKVGLALGSGSARGWSHIGVIRALEENGIKPDIVAGCSIGALVGAAYRGGQLDTLEKWVRALSFWDVVRLLDVKMMGGLIEGENLMASFEDKLRDINIEELSTPFAAVATDLGSGREMWLREGPLRNAVRASIALPGLFSPVRLGDRWLVDGGLTNPVPISLCRAMGADVIIAVNLNSDLVGRHLKSKEERSREIKDEERDLFNQLLSKLNSGILESKLARWGKNKKNGETVPGLFEVMASSINIMQDRITKSRMAGDPPDVLISPRLGKLGLLEFDRADEAIAEGYESVRRMGAALKHALDQ